MKVNISQCAGQVNCIYRARGGDEGGGAVGRGEDEIAPGDLHSHTGLTTFHRQICVHCSREICVLECREGRLQNVANCADQI